MQFLISDFLAILRIIALPDNRNLIGAFRKMTVDTVVAGVQRAILEPFDRNIGWPESGILDLGEGVHPIDALGLLRPKTIRILNRVRVHILILGVINVSAL